MPEDNLDTKTPEDLAQDLIDGTIDIESLDPNLLDPIARILFAMDQIKLADRVGKLAVQFHNASNDRRYIKYGDNVPGRVIPKERTPSPTIEGKSQGSSIRHGSIGRRAGSTSSRDSDSFQY